MDTASVKKEYDKLVKKKFGSSYEHNRWFAKRITWEQYRMTHASIQRNLKKFNKCLELGPGSGIWTRLLLFYQPKANFVTIDISESMFEQMSMNIGKRDNLRQIRADFMEHKFSEQFDFFFSSRVIEYLPDKRLILEKIYGLLEEKGRGLIITKTRHDFRSKVKYLFKRKRWLHTGQIAPEEMRVLLKEIGFKRIHITPTVILIPGFPFLHVISRYIWKHSYKKPLNWLSSILSESYTVSFSK